jgi:hypothetical protein
MLQLEGDLFRYALVMCSHGLGWFYARDAEWTRANLLSLRESENQENVQAFWAGFFWGARVPGPELYRELKESLLACTEGVEFSRTGHSRVLAGILLSGWGSIDETTGEPYISNEEFRDFLVKCDEKYRTHMLWRIRSLSTKDGGDQEWENQLVRLLTDVWPKQISAKSPATTMCLCDLAFSSKNIFDKTAQLVLPHLVKLNSGRMALFDMGNEAEQIIQDNPELVLSIVYKVLPDEASAWPFQTGEVLDAIEKADPALKNDERMIELRRKWNSR